MILKTPVMLKRGEILRPRLMPGQSEPLHLYRVERCGRDDHHPIFNLVVSLLDPTTGRPRQTSEGRTIEEIFAAGGDSRWLVVAMDVSYHNAELALAR